MRLITRKRLIAFVVLFALAAVAVIAVAQFSSLMPTYYYYGREITAGELRAMYEAGQKFHCSQLPTASGYMSGIADAYACFDTVEESDAFAETLIPEFERLEREVTQLSPAAAQEAFCVRLAAYVAQGYDTSLFNPAVFDLCNLPSEP
ncbi:MAG: hypothetical protein JW910_13515 [Anaerolineae bacterium]|nr:hypothetical protein [Anaerolineae bacterium]